MAVAVSRDLTVRVLEDVNVAKLTDRQQALRAAIQRGEPKCLGVSQLMLGLMVMSYSIPLHFTEVTEVVLLGVPWWSGLAFITAGVVAIILDKHCTMKILQVCLVVSMVSIVLSVVALIIYSVDMDKNPEVPCSKTMHGSCNEKHYVTSVGPVEPYGGAPLDTQNVYSTVKKYKRMSRGVKSSLLFFTLVETVISAVFCFILFRQRRSLGQYASLTEAASSSPTALVPPNLD